MHSYTDSLDSLMNIRTNPLNIHMDDGSDLVIGDPSPSQFVSTAKPAVVRARAFSSHSQTAVPVYADASFLSIHEPVQPLKIKPKQSSAWDASELSPVLSEQSAGSPGEPTGEPTGEPAESVSDLVDISLCSSVYDENAPASPSLSVPSLAELSIPNFSPLITPDLETFSLTRQGTIRTAAPVVSSGPSQSTELFKRIRSIRTNKPDTAADSPLPANLLKVIHFSPVPEGDWRDTSSICESVGACSSASATAANSASATAANSPAISESTLVSSSKVHVKAGSIASSPSVTEIPLSPGAPSERSSGSVRSPRSPNVCAAIEMTDAEAQMLARSPDLTETDPISESDRGRLFMQIRKLQGLRGVPVDSSRNPRFTITLDNGLQTVTTPPMPLPSSKYSTTLQARIGQEFELTVGRELELVMTINLLMDSVQPPTKPRVLGNRSPQSQELEPEAAPATTPPKSRVKSFFSPKRKQKTKESLKVQVKNQDEQIQLQREHDARMAEYRRRRDIWKGLTGPEGEYARGYLFETHYEREIYGKTEIYSLPLYNEWQGEDAQHMGDLELGLMFIPRLYGSEKLPQSLTQAQREIEAAKQERQFDCSGYLTQNGGDCNMYRRRYFTLNGNEFVAHHEANHKVRAVIHMENAIEVVDSEHVTPNDNMWCIYEDRSFLLVFSDGEEVSFYADTPELKTRWVQALSKSMTFSSGKSRTWTDLVLDRLN